MNDPASSASEGVGAFAFAQRHIDKPWGWEQIWAESDQYVGKILFVRAGEALSRQYHNQKDETWYFQSGRAEVELARAGEDKTATAVVEPGAAFHLKPGTVHRLRAIENTTVFEVSTPHLEDVVRLEDLYGRASG
jgi:mannose-6-phosphate isomerase-like protein (cupin superfamily)